MLIGLVLGVLRWMILHPWSGIPLFILSWAVFVHFKPMRECRWCRPGGLIGGSVPARMAGVKPGRKRKRRCWRCKGSKLTRRLGACHVHKVKLSIQQAWAERGSGE